MAELRPQPATTSGDGNLLAEVAWLYYGLDRTQDQIAQESGLSRPTVSRMLREARERGIVEIRVRYPFQTVTDLEERLKARLGLADCRVLAAQTGADLGPGDDVPARVGALAAKLLQARLPDAAVLGMGWGSMVCRVVASGYLANKPSATVAQIQGSIGGDSEEIDGAWLITALGRALGAKAHTLSAPMVVADRAVRQGLLRDQHIRQTLEVGKRADALLVGVGAVSPQSGLYRAGYLNDADLAFIRGEGAVGDVCGSYFAFDGGLRPLEMNERMVALPAEAMLGAGLRVGVSCGAEKALPNVGAARSGLVNVLITDDRAAVEMLRLVGDEAEAEGNRGGDGRAGG
jgi:DNA-binding transcriptional regulator LsrR (DeoR family)